MTQTEILNDSPITEAALSMLGYTSWNGDYWCPPPPAHGATYRLEFRATSFKGGKGKLNPIKGTEKWRAYLPYDILPTIRRFETLKELNYFHKGMCGEFLYPPE